MDWYGSGPWWHRVMRPQQVIALSPSPIARQSIRFRHRLTVVRLV